MDYKMKRTLYQKIYDSHIVKKNKNLNNSLIYIDLHLIHEVTSPQAFNSIKIKNRKVRNPEKTFATMDHNVPTNSRNIKDSGIMAKKQMNELINNCKKFNIKLYDLKNKNQGIVHIIGPENGMTLPGMTIVCGDSHTSTHGAFGSLAFGIGTYEVEHVLSTQTLNQKYYKNMKIEIKGNIPKNISAKDIILYIIGKMSSSGCNGYIIEFCGEVVSDLSMEGRMTICNMSIEMGAKSGIIAPDEITYKYLKNKKYSPKGENWKKSLKYWNNLKSDEDALFDKIVRFNISNIEPQITWGTNPGQVISINEKIPEISDFKDPIEKKSAIKSLEYMNIKPGQSLKNLSINKVFIGSCTNGRIEDLRDAAIVAKGNKIAKNVECLVVPGSQKVKIQAEKEGLDKIFLEAGFEWRLPGCSLCLAMNNDRLKPKERCASTSNRNFEGRQGNNSMTHLVSPSMAAAAAITGHFIDFRDII